MRYAVLLRGVNVGRNRRIAMADLRKQLAEHGFSDVRTHGQSGNVVLDSPRRAPALERELTELLGTRVVVRTAKELASAVAADPLGKASDNRSRYLVTFFGRAPSKSLAGELHELAAADGELVAVRGREAFSWHPGGLRESKLAKRLAAADDVAATARNWNTVTKLLALVQAD